MSTHHRPEQRRPFLASTMPAVLCALLACAGIAAGALPFPARLSDGDLASLPATVERVRPPTDALIVTPRANSEPPARDPRDAETYAGVCYAYLAEHGPYVRRFAAHVSDRDLLPFAQRAARLMALLWRTADRRLGTSLNGLRRETVHVWLARSGDGGFQDRGSIYVRNVLADRTGLEWARELAHEYGHYVLPGASGYADPEGWSNGLLGERLFLRWLRDDLARGNITPAELPFVSAEDLAYYCDRQVTPLISRVRRAGPNRELLQGRDARAMDAFTGLLLHADETYGASVLTGLLDYLPAGRAAGARGTDFAAAEQAWADGQTTLQTTVVCATPCMVYVPAGTYDVQGESGSVRSLTIGSGARVAQTGTGWTVRLTSPAWRAVTASGPGSATTICLRWRWRGSQGSKAADGAYKR